MSKRKPIDKEQARERRDRMLAAAAAAKLSLTEGVREMRTISGMTQEEFARHRGVSARVIKALELGQGNPTVATMNRIAQFFGLQVGFVPISRDASAADTPQPAPARTSKDGDTTDLVQVMLAMKEKFEADMRRWGDMVDRLETTVAQRNSLEPIAGSRSESSTGTPDVSGQAAKPATRTPKKRTSAQ